MTDAIEMRKRYLEQHANGNPALKDIIPATAANLFEDQFGIMVEDDAIMTLKTVDDVVKYIDSRA